MQSDGSLAGSEPTIPHRPTPAWQRPTPVWRAGLALLLLLALLIRWPVPSMPWTHIDEKAFVNHPLGFFSGDLNPHFFNYPTLQLYLTGAVYLAYWSCTDEDLLDFVAWRTFVDASDIMPLARGLTTLMAVATVAVTALIGRRLYGPVWGLVAAALLALAPLHTRFSHLAATDAPSLFWSSLALLWTLRAAGAGRQRDLLLAAVFCGLSAATKYPGVLCASAIVAAAFLGFPGKRLRVLLLAAAVATLTFACTTPYVWLDWAEALQDLSAMAAEHVVEDQHAAGTSGLQHLLGHNLRYGLGVATTLLLLVSLLWRPHRMTTPEIIVVAALLPAGLLAAGASSAFMRYAMPMAPMAVVLACRLPAWLFAHPSVASHRLARPGMALLVLGLLAEPAHAAWHQRSLLGSVDTRIEAQQMLADSLPQGGRIVHFSSWAGRPAGLTPDFIYRRQHRSAASFGQQGVAQMYRRLAQRGDLPPLYLNHTPGSIDAQGVNAPQGSLAVAWRLRHPLITDRGNTKALHLVTWNNTIDSGNPEQALFDPVDLLFVPLAGFDAVWRSGPEINVGQVYLPRLEPVPAAADYFRVLANLSDATVAFQGRRWEDANRLYDETLRVPYYLPELLSGSDLEGLFYGSGVSRYSLGDRDGAIDRWAEGVRLCPTQQLMRFNLAAILVEAGRYREAARHSVELLRQQPDHADGWHNLAVSLRRAGRSEDAADAQRQDPACLREDGALAQWLQ